MTTKKETPKMCEVCKKPDEYSEKVICVECFKKWQNINNVPKQLIHQKVRKLLKLIEEYKNRYAATSHEKVIVQNIENDVKEQFKEFL